MLVRLLMTGLLLISGMRGLQACIGEAGHFHLEIAHSHDDHCDGHSHPVEQPTSPQCEHSDDHLHIDLSIDEPINQATHRIALHKGQPRELATLPPVFPHGLTSFDQAMLPPSEIPRFCRTTFRNAAHLTIVLRL
jgi:hypothetical protein